MEIALSQGEFVLFQTSQVDAERRSSAAEHEQALVGGITPYAPMPEALSRFQADGSPWSKWLYIANWFAGGGPCALAGALTGMTVNQFCNFSSLPTAEFPEHPVSRRSRIARWRNVPYALWNWKSQGAI